MGLNAIKKELNKKFGEGSVISVSELDRDYDFSKTISSGSMSFDDLLGTGGIPPGVFFHIHGHYSSGKSTLATEICKQFLRAGKTIVYIDVEQTMGLTGQAYFRKLGIEEKYLDKILLVQKSDIKEIAITIEKSMVGNVDLIVVDTVAMITAKNPEDDAGSIDAGKTPQIGLQARIVSEELRRLNALKNKRTSILFLNQERAELSGYSKQNYRTPGGKALEHISEIIVRLDRLNHSDYIDRVSNGQGFESRAQVVKNKFYGRTYKKTSGVFFYQESAEKLGFDETYDLAHTARNLQIIKQLGPWTIWEREAGDIKHQGLANFIEKLSDEEYTELYNETRAKLLETLKQKL